MGNVFLDIETSWEGDITVIGIYTPGNGTVQLVGLKVMAANLMAALRDARIIYTYNGSRFDLPVIHRRLGIDLKAHFVHHDLMYDCWKNNLYGGLKKVEQLLGIGRDTEGLGGTDAMNLWQMYEKQNDKEALDILLKYNREDVENLCLVAERLSLCRI